MMEVIGVIEVLCFSNDTEGKQVQEDCIGEFDRRIHSSDQVFFQLP